MGKEKPGFLTPKAIANRIKSKGLQKLRWYCQMCQKQCRDENGFKCHTMSESHQRQLLIFGENPHKFLDEFSRDFHNGYINIVKRQFGTKRVNANVVYQEYIKDRDHVHMNSTKWLTLTGYVKWLGRNSICVVDETEKGWFITYIDRDPETLRRQQEQEKKKKLDLDDRQRQERFLEKQIERAKEKEEGKSYEPTELKKSDTDKITISFKKPAHISKTLTTSSTEDMPTTSTEINKEEPEEVEDNDVEEEPDDNNEESDEEEKGQDDDNQEEKGKKAVNDAVVKEQPATTMTKEESVFKKPFEVSDKKPAPVTLDSKLPVATPSTKSSSFPVKSHPHPVFQTEKRKKTALDELMEAEEKSKEKKNRKDYWLHKNIVVKINTNKVGEKYYMKKAVVKDVEDKYTGIVQLLDSNATIKLDQAYLETVLPALGKKVLILNGAYRGEQATLDQINEKDFTAKITISAGPLNGRVINAIDYDDISKLHVQD